MKILVTVKRVADPDMKIKVLADGSGIDMAGMNFKTNPFDDYAVEEALKLVEKHKGETVVVSIGPDDCKSVMRNALAMGADRGIHVAADAGLDPDAVSRILAKVAAKENPDLVILGKQAVDDDANQTGQLLAERLGWPQACFAYSVEVNGTTAKVGREVDGGTEIIEFTLPGIITADLRLNTPRYASLPNIMKAKKKPIEEIPAGSLGEDLAPKVKVLKVAEPPRRTAGRKVAGAAELVKALRNEAKVI